MIDDHFVFHSVWQCAASPSRVFSVLADFETYPQWWPEVREVKAIEGGYRTVCRAMLPYSLCFDTLQGRFDPEVGVIEGLLRGDLDGTACWTVAHDAGGGTRLDYEQHVRLGRRLLRILTPVARPIFIANHSVMMRRGERGLVRFLAQSQ